MHVCVHVCMCKCVCACLWACTRACRCACLCLCVCVHKYPHDFALSIFLFVSCHLQNWGCLLQSKYFSPFFMRILSVHSLAHFSVHVCVILGISMNARDGVFPTTSNKNYLLICRKTLMRNAVVDLVDFRLLAAISKSRSRKPRLLGLHCPWVYFHMIQAQSIDKTQEYLLTT